MMFKIDNGSFDFFTCITGRGTARYCVRVRGEARSEDGKTSLGIVSVSAFGDWQNALPQNLACLKGAIPADEITGLRRTRKGEFVASVSWDGDKFPVSESAGRMPGVILKSVQIDDPNAVVVKKSGVTYVSCD